MFGYGNSLRAEARLGGFECVLLDAPSYAHLVYRPAMPLVALTIARGRPVWSARGLESYTESRRPSRL